MLTPNHNMFNSYMESINAPIAIRAESSKDRSYCRGFLRVGYDSDNIYIESELNDFYSKVDADVLINLISSYPVDSCYLEQLINYLSSYKKFVDGISSF